CHICHVCVYQIRYFVRIYHVRCYVRVSQMLHANISCEYILLDDTCEYISLDIFRANVTFEYFIYHICHKSRVYARMRIACEYLICYVRVFYDICHYLMLDVTSEYLKCHMLRVTGECYVRVSHVISHILHDTCYERVYNMLRMLRTNVMCEYLMLDVTCYVRMLRASTLYSTCVSHMLHASTPIYHDMSRRVLYEGRNNNNDISKIVH
ncbi:hypothetical protein L9F63_016553, partial [Diploptera punctata]